MLKWWMRLAWFVSSYTPLWIILSIFNIPTQTGVDKLTKEAVMDGSLFLCLTFAFIAVISNAIIFRFIRHYETEYDDSIQVALDNPKMISELSKEYIVTYAISLIGFNLLDFRQAVSFVFLVLFFAFLYVKYNDITYNPMLDFFGFRIYEASLIRLDLPANSQGEYITTTTKKIISKRKRNQLDQEISISPIGDDIFIETIC